MKVALINSYYDYGSTGKIEKEIVDCLVENDDIPYVYYAWNTNFERNNNVYYFKYATTIEKYITALLIRFTGNRYGYAYFSTSKLIRKLKKDRPDVVHIHCPNSFDLNLKRLILYLKNNNIRTIITEHAEFYHTGNCPHSFDCDKWKTGCGNCGNLFFSTKSKFLDRSKKNWQEMKQAFDGFNSCTIVSVSDWLKHRTEQSPITKNLDIRRIHNGVDVKTFRFHQDSEITDKIKLNFNKQTILFVTSNLKNELKGFKYFLEITKHLPDINFLLVCNEHCDLSNYQNIKHIEYISDKDELSQLYSMADLSLLCSKRETFSMVVIESLCSGTPVVGFYAGGPESIAMSDYSKFSEFGDIDGIVKNIRVFLQTEFDKRKISEEAIKIYSSEIMAKKYCEIYRN